MTKRNKTKKESKVPYYIYAIGLIIATLFITNGIWQYWLFLNQNAVMILVITLAVVVLTFLFDRIFKIKLG